MEWFSTERAEVAARKDLRYARSMPLRFVLLALALCSLGCRGKMLATAELRGAGTAEARFAATTAKLALWADTDGKWRGGKRFPVSYDIAVTADGKRLGHVTCSTASVSLSVCGTSVTIGSSHSADCELKMGCSLPALPASGAVVLRVTARLGPGVESTKKVSLNVREE